MSYIRGQLSVSAMYVYHVVCNLVISFYVIKLNESEYMKVDSKANA